MKDAAVPNELIQLRNEAQPNYQLTVSSYRPRSKCDLPIAVEGYVWCDLIRVNWLSSSSSLSLGNQVIKAAQMSSKVLKLADEFSIYSDHLWPDFIFVSIWIKTKMKIHLFVILYFIYISRRSSKQKAFNLTWWNNLIYFCCGILFRKVYVTKSLVLKVDFIQLLVKVLSVEAGNFDWTIKKHLSPVVN